MLNKYLRNIFLLLTCIFAGQSFAQNLLPTPISVAPFYFNASPMMPPQIQQPYQLPNYWQQQPNLMQSLMPAFGEFASMLEADLTRGNDRYSYGDDYGNSRRDYETRSEFLYDPDRPRARRSLASSPSSERRSRSVVTTTVRATPAPTPTPTPTDCVECRSSNAGTPEVVEPQTTEVAQVAVQASSIVLDDTLRAYQESQGVRDMVAAIRSGALKRRTERRAIIGRKPADESLGRCLMYVKFAMLEGGFFSSYPSGLYASNFSPALERRGFVNLMRGNGYEITDPKDAPIGSVIVYENTPDPKTPGHIEVKLSDTDYGSDYIDDQPRSETSNNRKIIGIYAKLPAGDS
tara:strand:- start:992 stop:2035 length:1044 start_codon:yes stop_codon:yes gene_type:complete